MTEKRTHPRFKFNARCILQYEGSALEGSLVNISLGGAMLGLQESSMIAQEETCLLRIFTEGQETPDEIYVCVIYTSYFCIGVRFLDFTNSSHPRLYAQVELLSKAHEESRLAIPAWQGSSPER